MYEGGVNSFLLFSREYGINIPINLADNFDSNIECFISNIF